MACYSSPTRVVAKLQQGSSGSKSACVALAGALLFPIHAFAQQRPSAPSIGNASAESDRREEARVHFERAIALAQETRWQDAIREFEAARDLRATAAVYFNLALAYRAVGRVGEAIRTFREYLRVAGNDADRARAEQVAATIRELAAQLGRLRVDLEPPSAALTVDGAPVPSDTVWREVDPGHHVLVATADGHRGATRTVDVTPGGSLEIDMHLVLEANAARLQVESNVSAATIRMDGHVLSIGSADEYVPSGVHRIDVTAPHRVSFQRVVTVMPGTTTRVRAVLAEPATVSPWVWAGTVGGVVLTAGLVVGGIFLLSSVEPLIVVNNSPPVCVGAGCVH